MSHLYTIFSLSFLRIAVIWSKCEIAFNLPSRERGGFALKSIPRIYSWGWICLFTSARGSSHRAATFYSVRARALTRTKFSRFSGRAAPRRAIPSEFDDWERNYYILGFRYPFPARLYTCHWFPVLDIPFESMPVRITLRETSPPSKSETLVRVYREVTSWWVILISDSGEGCTRWFNQRADHTDFDIAAGYFVWFYKN